MPFGGIVLVAVRMIGERVVRARVAAGGCGGTLDAADFSTFDALTAPILGVSIVSAELAMLRIRVSTRKRRPAPRDEHFMKCIRE